MKKKPQKPAKAPTIGEVGNSLAIELHKITQKAEKQWEEREVQRKNDFDKFIDPDFDYSPTLDDFKQEVKAFHPTMQGFEYIKFLRNAKKKYGNSAYFYCTWGGSRANERRGDEHRLIVAFVSGELEAKINKLDLGIQKTKDSSNKLYGLKAELVELVIAAEKKAAAGEGKEISSWAKIRCAAFLEIMFDKRWFESRNRIKVLSGYAMAKYGQEIKIQLSGTTKIDRENLKRSFKKYF